ncbi:MAG: diguanylate phosphodiesterase, partial [Cellulomonas sp.]|nr:diguanylate phosphodiesterase [Cellulomonas sp.]
GVSPDFGDAVVSLSGRFGRVLAAVLAHEENDRAGVEATGLAPSEVSDAYLDAVGHSLGTAAALVDSRS